MLKIFAPAKINLHLHVIGKRPDGYHLLDSLVCFADTGDRLDFETAPEFKFSIEGPFSKKLSDAELQSSAHSTNTVVRAALLLAKTVNRDLTVHITLQKNLPLGAGIGGGSADAAACLWGLCQFWSLHLPTAQLENLALEIGSDVPVCLKSLPCLMQETGNLLRPAPELPEIPIVLIWPGIEATTEKVFKNIKSGTFSDHASFAPAYTDIKSLVSDLIFSTRNDLEVPALDLFPEISSALEILKAEPSCLLSRMTGSGSSVIGFFETEHQSQFVAEKLTRAFPDWWVRSCWLNRTARY